ncbi:pyridoxamine 5'-phosphate oxidase family protein [Dongia soli]|uniref:Pyridoxamine 5'-phosphate oxidase family protein n=1 Tax=Dongia soli TaxID=600628 RepID=A0ABU5EFQ8_9PROT|nr:pyridoxamine 5'-phosphate oxidase family protein [Dongia soli]MDY0885053.1 pyridoxamine 5'-phosphate oxidase family protein [Dongia soli]
MSALFSSSSASPWHAGERAIQEQAGVAAQMEGVGQRVMRSFMPDQHREFFAQLPFLVVGSVDGEGSPWASLLQGMPGFATSPDPQRLDIAAQPVAGDPLAETLHLGTRLGLLGIELPTRRRNRMNGRIIKMSGSGFSVAVEQSFGNCPQYIQARDYVDLSPAPEAVTVEPFLGLDEPARQLIVESDTFFVASAIPREDGGFDPDVSHRGGRPGFVRVDADGTLTIPDYAGNRFFNTLGNLSVYPRAGLSFIDFHKGDLLQLTGAASVVLNGSNAEMIEGVQRVWQVRPVRGRWLRNAVPLRFRFREFSPASMRAGIWSESHRTVDRGS